MGKKPLHVPTVEEDAEIQRGIDADPDVPELTDEDFAKMRPASEVVPEIVAAYKAGTLKRRRGERGPQKAPTKCLISIRFSREVLEYFRATGPGWQTRMDEALKEWIRSQRG